MDRANESLLAAFSTVLPLEGPAKAPCVNPLADEAPGSVSEGDAPAATDGDDEAITGAGGAYM